MYDFRKFNELVASRIVDYLKNDSTLYETINRKMKEENVDVVVPKEDKKFVPLRADEINVSAIRDTSGSNDVNIRGVKVYISSQFNNEPGLITDVVKQLSVEESIDRLNSLKPIDNLEVKPTTTFKSDVAIAGDVFFENYKYFKGYIAVKIESLYSKQPSSNSKVGYITRSKGGYYGVTDKIDTATYSNTIIDSLVMSYQAIEQRNSWGMYRHIASPEFIRNHRLTFYFKTYISGKSSKSEEISGDVLLYFINKFDFGTKHTPRFESCIYKGKRYRVIHDNKKCVLLHDGRWIEKGLVSELKAIH